MALAFVLLRVYESGFRKKEFQWADIWAILAMVSNTGLHRRCRRQGFVGKPQLTALAIKVSSIPMDVCEFYSKYTRVFACLAHDIPYQ